MKKITLIVFCAMNIYMLDAQNLVLNPGLDAFVTCPGFGQFSSTYVQSWDKPTIGSSDYYNYNCPGIQPSVQAPRNGEGYAGIICYNFGTEYREYITGTFSSPLVAGVTYNVEFYVSLHNGYIQAIEEVGAYISTMQPGPFSNALHINVTPQIENTSGALNDTANWKRINGQFVAGGGEMFITIGNFHDDAGTTITQPGSVGSFGAYYFIDDVSVLADSTTLLTDPAGYNNLSAWFGQGGELVVSLCGSGNAHIKPAAIKLFDASGRLCYSTYMVHQQQEFDTGANEKGVYVLVAVYGDGRAGIKKLIRL